TWLVRRQDRLNPVKDVQDERIPIGGTPGYATLNVRVGKTVGYRNQHRLSLSVENITDQPFLVHGSGVFGTGITGRFGYSGTY
ncbi:MAG: TonB-dependent receptor, partial [Planctomycetales bacterium]